MIRPIQQAADFRETLGLSRDQVVPDMVDLIRNAGYEYHEEDFGEDFFAFTQQLVGHKFLIGFNSKNQFGEPFKRFTLAHELGHVAMHSQILSSGKRHLSKSEGNSDEAIEREATEFAAYFLMPAQVFSQKCNALSFSPASIRVIAEHFIVSELAAAIHFTTHTDLACSLVVSGANGETKWENRSPNMKEMVGYVKFVRNSKIPTHSSTAEWVQGREVEQKTTMPLNDWMPDLRVNLETEEYVMKQANGLYLTLLTPLIPEQG